MNIIQKKLTLLIFFIVLSTSMMHSASAGQWVLTVAFVDMPATVNSQVGTGSSYTETNTGGATMTVNTNSASTVLSGACAIDLGKTGYTYYKYAWVTTCEATDPATSKTVTHTGQANINTQTTGVNAHAEDDDSVYLDVVEGTATTSGGSTITATASSHITAPTASGTDSKPCSATYTFSSNPTKIRLKGQVQPGSLAGAPFGTAHTESITGNICCQAVPDCLKEGLYLF